MIFSLQELFFLNTFLKYKKNYDYIKGESLKYKILLKKDNMISDMTKVKVLEKYSLKNCDFIPIGYIDRNKFIWMNDMNKIFADHIAQYNFNKSYLTDKLHNYLFSNNVILLKKHKYVIPYIILYTNPRWNIVEFIDENDIKFFGLIKLGINDIPNENIFEDMLNNIIQ